MTKFFFFEIDFASRISPQPRIKYLRIVRLIGFIVNLFVFIQMFVGNNVIHGFYKFYTNWGLMMTIFTFLILSISSFISSETNILHKFAYVLFEIIWTSNCVITIFFWGVLSWSGGAGSLGIWMIEAHTCPMLTTIADFIGTKLLMQFNHVLFVIIPGILYMILSIVYFVVDHDVFYNIMKWDSFQTYLIVIGFIGLYVGSFSLGWFIGKKLSYKEHLTTDS